MSKKYDYGDLKRKVNYYKDIPLSKINPDDVVDIKDIKIYKRKSSNERILDFLNDVENPYVFKIKGRLVKMSFKENGMEAEDCLTNCIKSLYR